MGATGFAEKAIAPMGRSYESQGTAQPGTTRSPRRLCSLVP